MTQTISSSTAFPHLFSPITVGPMRLRNRAMLPPHASAIGNIYGTDEEALRNIAYFEERVRNDGVAWVASLSTHLRNHLIPGFEPTGVGAATLGFFRLPYFVERVQQFSDSLHAHGATVSVQMVHQGGMPHGPSPVMSSPTINLMPHVMDQDDIDAFIREYAESARLSMEGRADGVELHLNHDDLHEWFLSPLTNHRTDKYGGSLENRCRFAVEVMQAIRDVIGTDMALGIRLNIREEVPGGYGVEGGVELAQYFESVGLIDYVHGVVGSPWGNPSYIQPTYFDPAQYADLSRQLKEGISLPVIHTGRINGPEVAEHVLASGSADIVGMARAHIADGELLLKARQGRLQDIRPCIGCNECISRRYVEGLPFGCAVNPQTGHEVEGPWPTAPHKRRLLVVGGGPAGMELAALAREGGLDVELWEAGNELGGQLRYAPMAPRHEKFGEYLQWQTRRLDVAGVEVKLDRRVTADEVRSFGADVVAVATGATSRTPPIDGVDADNVFDIRDVMSDRVHPGRRVAVIAQDDHVPPLSVADKLASAGHQVSVFYATGQAAPLLGRYILGGIMGRLDVNNVCFNYNEEVVSIGAHTLEARNVYSWKSRTHGKFDSFVLACGGVSESSIYDELNGELAEIHLLGDAYAPRRLVFATQQAHALAEQLVNHRWMESR